MVPKKIADEIKGKIKAFLGLKFSISLIQKELKKQNINISRGSISNIKNENNKKDKTKPSCVKSKKGRGRPRALSSVQLNQLKNAINKPNPPSNTQLSKKFNISRTAIGYNIKKILNFTKVSKGSVHHLTDIILQLKREGIDLGACTQY